jgi:hypothetical protein
LKKRGATTTTTTQGSSKREKGETHISLLATHLNPLPCAFKRSMLILFYILFGSST